MAQALSVRLTQETLDNIDRARLALFTRWPFLGELVKYLRPIESTATPTACVTSSGQMLINSQFANRATVDDLIFILAHEAMHIVAGSIGRKPEHAQPELWNCAADIAINQTILRQGIRPPRAELIQPLYGHKFAKYVGKTHEEIYHALPKGFSKGGFWCDECPDLEDRVLWSERVQAARAATGKGPGDLEVFQATLRTPKRPWLQALARVLQQELRQRYSWRRPNRRTIATDVFTPSPQGQNPCIAIYLDTSGSMYDDVLNESLSEIAALVQLFGAAATLILADAEVYFYGPISVDSLHRLPMQRGGTDFRVVFERLKRERFVPKVFIGFSDLEGPFPEQAPEYPVHWFTRGGKAPWGRITCVEADTGSTRSDTHK